MQTMHGLLTALQGLHARGIAHGAVAADSLYVNATKTEDGQRMYDVKLINFASAVQFAAGAPGGACLPAFGHLWSSTPGASTVAPGERVLDGKLLDLDKDPDTIAPEVRGACIRLHPCRGGL